MAQTWNYQTFYTAKEAELDEKLRYFNSIVGDADEYEQPLTFRNLYKLAFDFIDLHEESSYNFVVYGLSGAGPPGADLLPAAINTNARTVEAFNLYCKNMGIVIAAKILQATNVNDVKDWILENGVFQETMPTATLTFTPTPPPPAVAVAIPNLSGPNVIERYATEVITAEIAAKPALDTPILQQNLVILHTIVVDFFDAANPSKCLRFLAELRTWNALGAVDYAALEVALQAAQGRLAAFGFNAVNFLKNILLVMNRTSAALHSKYELTQQLLNNTPISFSSVKTEIDSDILETIQASTLAAAPNVLPQGEELTSDIYTKGTVGSVQDQLITAMPNRLTHTCYPITANVPSNQIYNSNPPYVKVMSLGTKIYVSPIQTREDNVAVIRRETTPWGLTIEGYTAVVATNPINPPPAIPRNPISVGTTIQVLDVAKAMPGPNPQPLDKNYKKISNDKVSRSTTDAYDVANMRMLSPHYISMSGIKGHGDWQSMPNYATIDMIMHSDKSFTLNSNGYYLGNEIATGIRVFQFKRTWPMRDTFVVPKNDSNCMLPWHWELYAMYPTGKLLYYDTQNKVPTVNPPLGTYWKEWRGADYSMAYVAEIGYQEAKAKYEGGSGPRLSVDDQVALFQMGAHLKTIEYVSRINARRRGGGSSGKNKKKQHKKKTMSILKTAKRKYFTKRNNKKRNLY